MFALKSLGLDSGLAVKHSHYLFHCIFVVISDYYLWKVGKLTVGKQATQVAFIFYLTNRV